MNANSPLQRKISADYFQFEDRRNELNISASDRIHEDYNTLISRNDNAQIMSSVKSEYNEDFSNRENLKQNRKKIFLCNECNKYFLKLDLFNHMKCVHDKYTCLYCYGFFLKIEDLEKHLMKKHGVENSLFFDAKAFHSYINFKEGEFTKALSGICCKCTSIINIKENNFFLHLCNNSNNYLLSMETSSDKNQEYFLNDKSSFVNQNSIENNAKEMTQFIGEKNTIELNKNIKENCHPHDEKVMARPKITLKIPKDFQKHHKIYAENNSDSTHSCELLNDNTGQLESSLTLESNEKNLPSLKLKIKNLKSNNPKSVLENSTTLNEIENPVESSISGTGTLKVNSSENADSEINLQDNNIFTNTIFTDGKEFKPANEDTYSFKIQLNESLQKIPIVKLMKICLHATIPNCLYCNHARKIVVNGKGLAIHFITQHRFHAFVNSITEEELDSEKILCKLKNSLDELDGCFFNLDTYDNNDTEKNEGHVTISHEKLYECFQCRFQTPIHKELYLHNRKMHQKSQINCLMCKNGFYSYSELLCHICPGITKKQTYYDLKFYCCLCNLNNIPSAFRLMVHLRKKHLACDVCLEKCSDQNKLSSHVWKHKLLHMCYRCNVFYQNKADIQKHLFWKHGTEGIECEKCLQKKWPHVYHFCIPAQFFTCQYCEMQFSRSMALKVHLRLHEDDGAKHLCSEENCEKRFISKKLLLRHINRHHSKDFFGSGKEGNILSTGIVITPKEIPNGFCTRTMPIVFKRFVEKSVTESITNDESEKKDKKCNNEEKENEKMENLTQFPQAKNLNLSESSGDESSDDLVRTKNSFSVSTEKEENKLISNQTPEESNGTILNNLPKGNLEMENSQTLEFQNNETFNDKNESNENKSVEKSRKRTLSNNYHVCISDHDYAKLYKHGMTLEDHRSLDETVDATSKKITDNTIKDTDNLSSSNTSSNSSSGSSSDTSSNVSSESSSDSSSSEASSTSTSWQRKKKYTKRRSKIKKIGCQETEISRDPDDIICESDLQTDELETDEDFYDEHPLKNIQILNKTKVLSDSNANIQNSQKPTPNTRSFEKVKKLKKRKQEYKKMKCSDDIEIDGNFSPNNEKSFNKNNNKRPTNQKESHQLEEIRELLHLNENLRSENFFQNFEVANTDYINANQISSAYSSRLNSDSESAIKRSQRRRIPNKFYGYTSDDDNSLKPNMHFNSMKPVLPPQLTWRKEDLPERIVDSYVDTPSTIEHSDHFTNNSIPFNTFDRQDSPTVSKSHKNSPPPVFKHKIKKKFRNVNKFNSPDSAKPPIPRLKLTIANNNKIKRQFIGLPKERRKKLQDTKNMKEDIKNNDSSFLKKGTFESPKQVLPIHFKRIFENESQTKLEEAIQNTQQYFQRYNHTQLSNSEISNLVSDDVRVYCYCRRPYDDLQGMIGCDGSNCQIEWFHFECVGILVPPKGSWFCPQCSKQK